VLGGWGILPTPAVGTVLMSASTVIVAINAQLLRRVTLQPVKYKLSRGSIAAPAS